MKSLFVVSALFMSVLVSAQETSAEEDFQRLRAQMALKNISERGVRFEGAWATFEGTPPPPGETIGDTYLEATFNPGNVILKDKERMLEYFRIRYDIHRDEMEFKTSNGVRVLSGAKIKSFVMLDSISGKHRYFMRGNVLSTSRDLLYDGFFEVLNEGAVPVLKRSSIIIKKADYRPELDVGTRDTRILKKHEYFLLIDKNIREVPGQKKKVFDMFGSHEQAIEAFAKENDLNPSKESDLIRIVDHYNSLIAATN